MPESPVAPAERRAGEGRPPRFHVPFVPLAPLAPLHSRRGRASEAAAALSPCRQGWRGGSIADIAAPCGLPRGELMSRFRSEVLDWFDAGRVVPGREQEALRAAGVTPSPAEWRAFLGQLTLWLGTIALAAAVIFFFAFNWDDLGRFAKFGLVEAAILAGSPGLLAGRSGRDARQGRPAAAEPADRRPAGAVGAGLPDRRGHVRAVRLVGRPHPALGAGEPLQPLVAGLARPSQPRRLFLFRDRLEFRGPGLGPVRPQHARSGPLGSGAPLRAALASGQLAAAAGDDRQRDLGDCPRHLGDRRYRRKRRPSGPCRSGLCRLACGALLAGTGASGPICSCWPAACSA